ncbi:MAG: substrate-binding domain-containing protein [Scytonema sp. PMC 1069.18]|nr:substrate-binding domain-containing protein [Scytonema sp. PMC 1069.18]MEC4888138.1 substrate-binding domain-containing protein [Scytonema sp. PMC 1070.18]
MLTRLARTVSITALWFGVAMAAMPTQKAYSQTILDGIGSISIAIPSILENWFGRDTNNSTQPTVFFDADGDGVIEPNEEFLFWDGLKEQNPFASYVVAQSPIGRSAIQGTGGFLFDFYSSTATVVNDAPGSLIVNINPVDIPVVLPVNVDFNGDGVNDFRVRLNLRQACRIATGDITNWQQIGGPNAPIRRVIRSDASVITTALSRAVEKCGIELANSDGSVNRDAIQFDSGRDFAELRPEGVIDRVTSTAGTIGYVEIGSALNVGLKVKRDLVALRPTFSDINGDGVVSGGGETKLGFTFGTVSNYVGFYLSRGTAQEREAAAKLCLYLTRGVDFNQDGVIDPNSESGRLFATDVTELLAPPSRKDLDPNCGTLMPGFPGLDADGSGVIGDNPQDLLPGGATPIPGPTN